MRVQAVSSSIRFGTVTVLLLLAGAAAQAQDFEVADIYFELNDTDDDLGIHALIDGSAWRALEVETPRASQGLWIALSGSFRKQGLTELFFESAEPNFDRLSPEQFFRRFPEGEYEITATSVLGVEFETTDMVTQVMPAPPEFTVNGMELPEDCDQGVPSLSEPFMVSWDPVTMSHPEIGRSGQSIEVAKYQLVLEREDEALIVSIDLPPDITEVEIPAGLAEPGDEFKVELLVKETSGGNQTSVETCGFEVE